MRWLIVALLFLPHSMLLSAAEKGPRCLAELEWLAKQAFEKPKDLEEAFRAGPFEPPLIGESDSPLVLSVTTHAGAQRCFDAGMTRLINLWPEEAERCFREAVKLDSKCVMAWWGLAAANERFPGRGQFFIEKALELTKADSPERAWLDVWNSFFHPAAGFTMSEHLMKHAASLAELDKLGLLWAKTFSQSLLLRWEVMAGMRGSGMLGASEKLAKVFEEKKDEAWIWPLALMSSSKPETREMQWMAARRVIGMKEQTPGLLRLAAEVLWREGDREQALKTLQAALAMGMQHANAHLEPLEQANDWTEHAVTFANWLVEAGGHAEANEIASELISLPRRPRFTARGELDDEASATYTSGRRLFASLFTRRRDWQGLGEAASSGPLAGNAGLVARADACYWRALAAAGLRDEAELTKETQRLQDFVMQTREAAFLNAHADEVASLLEGLRTLAGRVTRRGVFVAKPVRDVPVDVVRTPVGAVTPIESPASQMKLIANATTQVPALKLKDHEGKLHDLHARRGKWTLVIFFLGHGCVHCTEQLRLFAPMMPRFGELGLETWTVSTDSVSDLHLTMGEREPDDPPFPFLVLSDESQACFASWHCHDAFLNKAMHGTFLVDPEGFIRWSDISNEPYSHPEFLVEECGRLMRLHTK